jgi:aminoglycoside phosphotransferase (APT) family kinase protein
MEAVLAKGPPGKGNGLRLLHGDFWAGNLLWREGALVGVVDWEDAALGEPLLDLAQARVELVWLFGVEGAARFTNYYQQGVDLDFTNLPYWDLCAVLRLLRLVRGDWGWLVDFVRPYGRVDLTGERIGEEVGRFVNNEM